MKVRVGNYRRQLENTDWEVLWRLEVFDSEEFAGFSAVMQGTKPAWIPESFDTAKRLLSLVPDEIANVVLTNNGWIADLGLIRRVLRKYPDYFQDFDYGLIDENQYLAEYLNVRTTLTTDKIPPEEIIKTGLLLGFPHQSVIARGEHVINFKNYGFMFGCSPTDYDSFLGFLKSAFENNGMKKLKAEVRKKIRTGFAEMISVYDGGIEILEIDGRRYLEVVTVKKKENEVKRQLLLWREGEVGEDSRRALLNAFSKRYGAKSFIYETDRMGTEHLNYMDFLNEIGPDQLPYMIMIEYADKVMFQPAGIDRSALEDYVRKNLG